MQPVAVHGVLVPSIYSVSFAGKTSASHFVHLAGRVKFSSPSPRDTNPFRVTLETDLQGVVGGLFWQSFNEQLSKFPDSPTLRCIVRAGHEITELRTPIPGMVDSFVVPDPSGPLINFGMPVVIGSGEFEFEIERDRITGRIRLSGDHFLGLMDYDATCEGGRAIISPESDQPTLSAPLFEADHETSGSIHDLTGLWSSEQLGTFELSNSAGHTYRGSYQQDSGASGTVEGEVDDFGRATFVFRSDKEVWAFTKVQHEKGALVGQIVRRTGEDFPFVALRSMR